MRTATFQRGGPAANDDSDTRSFNPPSRPTQDSGPVPAGSIADPALRRIVVPIFDAHYDQLIDVVSWPHDMPSAWSLKRQAATIAGLPCLRISYLWDLPCPIWRTPAAWHAHHEHGICVLHWEIARFDLWDVQLVAEDVHHGHEIRQRILGPPRPEPRIAIRRAVA